MTELKKQAYSNEWDYSKNSLCPLEEFSFCFFFFYTKAWQFLHAYLLSGNFLLTAYYLQGVNRLSFGFVFQISLCHEVDVFISALKLLMPVLAMASVASPVLFKEFCPLYYLLNAIPTKIQKGFRSIVVYLTALDTNGDYIAVGSSIGMLYLYCRHLNQMKKYNFEVNTNF